jgi:hypothetical protein
LELETAAAELRQHDRPDNQKGKRNAEHIADI